MMTAFDILILVIVGISCLFGLWRGFIREVISVAAWIAALVAAKVYSPSLAPWFSGFIDNETGRYILAFAILCLVVLLVGALAQKVLSELISMAGLQITDRLLGAVFGVARGVIIVAVIVYFATGFYAEETWWQQSWTVPYIEDVIEQSRLFLSDYGAEI